EKSVFYVGERLPERMAEGFPLEAIVAPHVTGAEPRHTPLGAAGALAALAPSTLLQLVPAEPQALSAMAGLVSRVPTFGLEVGGAQHGGRALAGRARGEPRLRRSPAADASERAGRVPARASGGRCRVRSPGVAQRPGVDGARRRLRRPRRHSALVDHGQARGL